MRKISHWLCDVTLLDKRLQIQFQRNERIVLMSRNEVRLNDNAGADKRMLVEDAMAENYKYPAPLFARKVSVEQFAKNIAGKLNFTAGGDIAALVKRLGGTIVIGSTSPEDQESGSIIARSLSDFTIFISEFTSIERDRFTIAHELGHLLLHLPKLQKENPSSVMRATRFVDERDDVQQRTEWEANWFAAALLMPEDDFKRIYPLGESEAQAFFKVSRSALSARAKSLKLI